MTHRCADCANAHANARQRTPTHRHDATQHDTPRHAIPTQAMHKLLLTWRNLDATHRVKLRLADCHADGGASHRRTVQPRIMQARTANAGPPLREPKRNREHAALARSLQVRCTRAFSAGASGMQGVASLGLKRVHKREAEEWGYYRGVMLWLSSGFSVEMDADELEVAGFICVLSKKNIISCGVDNRMNMLDNTLA